MRAPILPPTANVEKRLKYQVASYEPNVNVNNAATRVSIEEALV